MIRWGELLEHIIEKLREDEGFYDQTVTVYCMESEEYFVCDTLEFTDHADILDEGVTYLVISA